MGAEETEMWKAYRDDPNRLEVKAQEKRKRQEEKGDAMRERKVHKPSERLVRRHEEPYQPCCNEWLCHQGNVHYARNRSDFKTYTAIDATAVAAQDGQEVRVFGIGTVEIEVKRQLFQETVTTITLSGVLHIPRARCNGYSIPRSKHRGFEIKVREDDFFTIFDKSSNGSFCCGSEASGRRRLFMAGEKQASSTLTHVTLPGSIDINADWSAIDSLRKWTADCQTSSGIDHHSLPTCEDWMCHSGNVDFARQRSSFETYQAIDGYVISANNNARLRVLGIGTMTVRFRQSVESTQTRSLEFIDVLHIPEARCNGVSLPLLKDAGYIITEERDGLHFSVQQEQEPEDALCGRLKSGRMTFYLAGESLASGSSPQPTEGGNISLRVDMKRFGEWRTLARHTRGELEPRRVGICASAWKVRRA